ncbi:hypothetical protein B8V57_07545 [Streptococcus agalactiae]|nr:hypothetical protein A6J68_09935 [Streptococcus sp. 'group B']ASA94840.1 hypothetical protein BB162_08475 [Streptococcus agalactiae]AWZ35532.1 hypothetical protein CCZ24_01345 [Streptococcus agalactiae]KAA9055750.1 hypothetical protein F5G76_02325 [Streptococcus agalactiae]KAA9061454.1 hypothetical protein F5G80_02470 [Streptococcus agalactiae]
MLQSYLRPLGDFIYLSRNQTHTKSINYLRKQVICDKIS